MATMPTPSRPPVLYQLSNEEQNLSIRIVVAVDGSILKLSYQDGDTEPREFAPAQIATPGPDDVIRATIVLDDGGSSLVETTFELVLPGVFVGSDVSEQGPFGVLAAGLRIKHFIVTTDSIPPGPLQEVEAIQLFARAIAQHPEGSEEPAVVA